MNQRRDYQKNALQTNVASRQQAAFYHQMEAAWDMDQTPANSIKRTKLISWLVQVRGRLNLLSNQPACDCPPACDCQAACSCG